jgi:hypothetical protein
VGFEVWRSLDACPLTGARTSNRSSTFISTLLTGSLDPHSHSIRELRRAADRQLADAGAIDANFDVIRTGGRESPVSVRSSRILKT